MDRLKQLLAFPLYAAAAWLVWVLSIQAGPSGVLAALGAMILVAFAVWLLGATRGLGRRGRALGSVATMFVAVSAVGLGFVPRVAVPAPEPGVQAAPVDRPKHAETFSAARLQALRGAGAPVFVNITAAWCITCKLNEQVALSSDRIARAFADRGIVYLKGDWTSRDAEISRYLNAYGRGGVPLYVLYKGDAEPLVLPQILTESLVLEAIEGLPRIPSFTTLEKRNS
jgi:thiol:disulfide interchange protein DsbD